MKCLSWIVKPHETKKRLSIFIALSLVFFLILDARTESGNAWNCPECGRVGNTGNYCGECAHASPYLEEQSEESAQVQAEDKAAAFRTVGNIVTFGRYEQDNNTANGPEAIEWIVLDYDEKEHKSLLLSKYGLDAKPYHQKQEAVTWEECTLRTWLNDEFFQSAFAAKGQKAILKNIVNNNSQGYSGWNTSGGNNTEDKIFLLSYHEAFDLYFSSNYERMCAPTDYAIAHGAYSSQDEHCYGWWWLRSPGRNQYDAALVYADGSLANRDVSRVDGCVRPALWINLESDIF